MNKELLRMQMLAGIITESQYAAKLNEEENSLVTQYTPKYKSLIDSEYASLFNLNDPEEFKAEIDGGGDSIHDLAYDIAKDSGFKGDVMSFLNYEDEAFVRYCTHLAHLFLLQYGMDTGVISKDDPKYQQDFRTQTKYVNDNKSKIKNLTFNNDNIMDVIAVLNRNGIDEDYFESMGGKEVEGGTEEWLDVLSDITGKNAYSDEFTPKDDKLIRKFIFDMEAMGIELI